MFDLKAMNKIFSEIYKYFLETRNMPSPTPEQLERKRKQQEWETYVNNLPPLEKGTYKVKFLRQVRSLYGTIVGEQGEIIEMRNDGTKPSNVSMGGLDITQVVLIKMGMV